MFYIFSSDILVLRWIDPAYGRGILHQPRLACYRFILHHDQPRPMIETSLQQDDDEDETEDDDDEEEKDQDTSTDYESSQPVQYDPASTSAQRERRKRDA